MWLPTADCLFLVEIPGSSKEKSWNEDIEGAQKKEKTAQERCTRNYLGNDFLAPSNHMTFGHLSFWK